MPQVGPQQTPYFHSTLLDGAALSSACLMQLLTCALLHIAAPFTPLGQGLSRTQQMLADLAQADHEYEQLLLAQEVS